MMLTVTAPAGAVVDVVDVVGVGVLGLLALDE